ncbi:bladder cancer-associated protein [Sceloporus undulatus]|nr:bladder cancer-associated protein [Sceloporus undulatus]
MKPADPISEELKAQRKSFTLLLCIAGITVTPRSSDTMYCLQWLLPVLLIPKPLNPALWFSHSMFMGFYLLSFLLERKPCTICALVFLAALFLICYSCWGNCFLYHCSGSQLPDSAHDPNIVGT